MLILNSDLYSQHRPPQPMSLKNFIQSLREIPACAELPEEELRRIYMSIKNERLPVARGKNGTRNLIDLMARQLLPINRFIHLAFNNAVETFPIDLYLEGLIDWL